MIEIATRRRRFAVLGAACALTLVACGSGSGDDATPVEPTEPPATEAPAGDVAEPTEPAPEPTEPAPEPTVAPAEAPPILQFNAPLVGGGEIDAATTAGSPTVFWFWAPT